ncbi:hypothetical protein BDV59DRAFT_188223 [Aspergillus ambiguus]|uniref:uncharacterized protein n=1 Tax=Aspergillus ambiguus TaxID=176160 RepID=UPI003CCCC424
MDVSSFSMYISTCLLYFLALIAICARILRLPSPQVEPGHKVGLSRLGYKRLYPMCVVGWVPVRPPAITLAMLV